MIAPDTRLDVLLPVYNEAASIEGTLRELHQVLSRFARVEFVVSEDGSTDASRDVLLRLDGELPLRFVFGDERKGYSRAVIDAMRASSAPWVLCLDSDGQCDPRDFAAFGEHAGAADLVIGWRVRRQDRLARRVMSRLFGRIYRALLGVKLKDPSCPYLLVSRRALDYVLAVPTLGQLQQGFWWEFVARIVRAGFPLVEVPISHRPRASGRTQVYRVVRMPGIFISHVWGLWKIRREVV